MSISNSIGQQGEEDGVKEKDLPLRADIRMLGKMLGDTLRKHEGTHTYNLVENVRQMAIRFHREQDLQARVDLDNKLNQLSNRDITIVVRAFSYFSQLSNIAEELHHNRRRRAHRSDGTAGEDKIEHHLSSPKTTTLHDLTRLIIEHKVR